MAILTFDRYAALVYIVKILISHFRQLLRWWYCSRSCFLQSMNQTCH